MSYHCFLHWLGGIPKKDVNWLQYAIISTWEVMIKKLHQTKILIF